MEKIELIVMAAIVLVNLVNALTPHWSERVGLARFALKLTEALSFISSKGGSLGLKLPGKVD